MPVPDYTDSRSTSLLEGCDGAAGMVSVLAERAASEGPRSTRAVETTPAASPGEYRGTILGDD
jgi:hypothetical protein